MVFHYTAGPPSATAHDVAAYQTGPGAQLDFPGIAYHYHVDGTGRAAFCQDLDRRVWGSDGPGWNERACHVCWSGTVRPNDAQIKGLRACHADAQRRLGRKLAPYGHRETGATACPGPHLAEWKPLVTAPFP